MAEIIMPTPEQLLAMPLRDNDNLPDAAGCLDNEVRRHGRPQKPLAPGRYPVDFDVIDEEDIELILIDDRAGAVA